MNDFEDYVGSKIFELSEEAKKLEENYRQDEANFVKIRINIYEVCKTVFNVFLKTKQKEDFFEEYLKKLDEFKKIWSDSKEKAEKFGDLKKIAIEEEKLCSLAEIREKFTMLWGE